MSLDTPELSEMNRGALSPSSTVKVTIARPPKRSTRPDGRGMTPPNPGRPLEAGERDFVLKCVEQVVVVMRLYGFDDKGYSLRGTLEHWYRCAGVVGDVVKFVKWKFAAYYAAHAQCMDKSECQEIPDSPLVDLGIDDPRVLVGGRGYRFLLALERDEPERFISWANSVLMIKKGCPRPSDALLKETIQKTVDTLTTPSSGPAVCTLSSDVVLAHADELGWGNDQKPADVFRWSRTTMDRSSFIEQLIRTTEEVIGDRKFTVEDRIKPFFPSTSANYINSRGNGGAVGHLLEKYPELFARLRKKYGARPLVHTNGRNVVLPDGTSVVQNVTSNGGLLGAFAELYDEVKIGAVSELPIVKPVGLKEALKIRVISKGPPLKYTMLKPLQKFLWRCVRRMKAGRLVGEPVDRWVIHDALGAKLGDGQRYLSVDYSDATNKMFSWVTEAVTTTISAQLRLDEDEAVILNESLIHHFIFDPKTKREKPQRRGQLMGSVVSFPLLCIVNMTLLRMTKEFELCRKLTVDECGMLVNGDDGVIRTTELGYRYWQMVASFVGLEPSVGKVYFSSSFLNMNSRTFLHREGEEELFESETRPSVMRTCWFQEVPFVNLGLLYGMDRSTNDAVNSKTQLTSLASRAHDLIKCAPPYLRVALLKSYMSRHKDELQKLCLPYFLPTHLGGVGLPILPDELLVKEADRDLLLPSDTDLRLARVIYEHSDLFPLPPPPPVDDWKIWSRAQALARKQGLRLDDVAIATLDVMKLWSPLNVEYVSAQTLMTNYVVEALFQAKDLASLFKEVTDATKNKLLNQYYDKIRTSVTKARRNKTFPLQSAWPFLAHALPKPRPDLRELKVFPLVKYATIETGSEMTNLESLPPCFRCSTLGSSHDSDASRVACSTPSPLVVQGKGELSDVTESESLRPSCLKDEV